jgi:anti-sigma regulatory factor (Ser/Thr protein kinase)
VHLRVSLASTLAGAHLLLDTRPSRVARDHELPCDSTAPGLARSAVASMCVDWELDDGVYDAAATVATELVSNAVCHADTASVLHLTLDRRHLQIAVRDSRPITEGRPRTATPCDRYGLLIVQGLSRGWGVSPSAGGKIVWALLDAGPE